MCERIAASSLAPVSDLLTKIFEGLGATFSDIETMTVADFLVARYRGDGSSGKSRQWLAKIAGLSMCV